VSYFARRCEVAIHSQRREQRTDRLENGIEEQQDQCRYNGQFVRPDIGEQASHQTPVVGFS